jgi:hypothetical protein
MRYDSRGAVSVAPRFVARSLGPRKVAVQWMPRAGTEFMTRPLGPLRCIAVPQIALLLQRRTFQMRLGTRYDQQNTVSSLCYRHKRLEYLLIPLHLKLTFSAVSYLPITPLGLHNRHYDCRNEVGRP